jgi:hypothetical protein
LPADHVDDLTDTLRRGLDALHRHDRVVDDLARHVGLGARAMHRGSRFAGAQGGGFDIGGDLFQRRRCLLERCRLLLGALGEIVRRQRYVLGAPGDDGDGSRDIGEHAAQLADGTVEILTEGFELQ